MQDLHGAVELGRYGMSARVEAAKAAANEVDHEDHDDAVVVALAAADAVMFSEEAVESAAKEVHGEYGEFWAAMTEEEREVRRNVVRCVIEALKGFGDE
jgi:hypothetical protein